MERKTIGVVYLAWLPYGVELMNRFLQSYQNHPSGHEHHLYIIFNGTALVHDPVIKKFEELLLHCKIPVQQIIRIEQGQDIFAYQTAAKVIQEDYILFLNSYTQFLANDWLKKYADAWKEGVGVIGATASHASYVQSIKNNFNRNKQSYSWGKWFKEWKYIKKLDWVLGSKFTGFPNPHIRTNAFFIQRNVFLSLTFGPLRTKHEAYFFENGRQSMTNQLLQRKLTCCVVDKTGKVYELMDAKKSKTFWIEDQQNLMISDNQTDSYTFGDDAKRKALMEDAWGLAK